MISIRDLKKTYSRGGDDVVACEVARLDIASGEHVALVGPSGLGKSTLLNMLAGITLPDSGVVEVAGVKVNELSEGARDRFRAQHIGMVFQTLNLLMPFSALENVLLGAVFGQGHHRGTKVRAEYLLERVGLKERLHHRPNELSLGQAQRVAMCRALINDPEIDARRRAARQPGQGDRVSDVLAVCCSSWRPRADRTVLMVTHDPESADQMQRTRRFGRA